MCEPVTIELPGEISADAKALAKEWAIVGLQQEGELTIREAAGLLGLTYEGYLALLHKKGLPASNLIDEDDETHQRLLVHAERVREERAKVKLR